MAIYLKTLMKNFTDRTDVDFEISLFEYGIIRNPKNDMTIFKQGNEFVVTHISLEDVQEALREAEEGFYSYIGSDLNTELERLDKDLLAHIIQSLNSYSGIYYNDSEFHYSSLKQLLRSFN